MLTAICVSVDIRFGGFAGTGLDGTNSSDSSMDIEDIEATDMILYVQMRQENSQTYESRFTDRQRAASFYTLTFPQIDS